MHVLRRTSTSRLVMSCLFLCPVPWLCFLALSLQAVALVGRECFELAALLSVQQMQHHQLQTEGGSPADVFDETIEGEDDFERHMMMLLPYYTDYADVSLCVYLCVFAYTSSSISAAVQIHRNARPPQVCLSTCRSIHLSIDLLFCLHHW